jgi:hypothetical protein
MIERSGLQTSSKGSSAKSAEIPRRSRRAVASAITDRVGVEHVKRNLECCGLLDDQVKFLPGWFRDTSPKASIKQRAVLRPPAFGNPVEPGTNRTRPPVRAGGVSPPQDLLPLSIPSYSNRPVAALVRSSTETGNVPHDERCAH